MPKKIYKRKCNTCGKYYEGVGKYFCSRKCVRFSKKRKESISKRMRGNTCGFQKGKSSWNKGKHNYWLRGKLNPNWKGNTQRGNNSHNWRGNRVSYRSLHNWICRYKGKPKKCEHCGKDGLTGHQIHWANKDHEYKRNLTDWIRLCAKCHKRYDKLHRLSRKDC